MGRKDWIDKLNYRYRNGKIFYSFDGEDKCIVNCDHFKYAYDHVLELFYSSADHYMKRTQIVMIAIQVAIIVGLTNLWKYNQENRLEDALGVNLGTLTILFAFLGLFAGYIWILAIRKNHRHMDLFRQYLREIEKQLAMLGLPLYTFTLDKRIFGGKTSCNYDFFHGESFATGKHRMMRLDQCVVVSLMSLWAGLIIIILFKCWFKIDLIILLFEFAVFIIAFIIFHLIDQWLEEKRKKIEDEMPSCDNLKKRIERQTEIIEKQNRQIKMLKMKYWNFRR